MRPNCPYQNCYCRAGKNGFCLKHKDIGEVIEALVLLKYGDNTRKVTRTLRTEQAPSSNV